MRLSNLHYPLGAGLSHETILFDADWTEGGAAQQRGMVVRIKPSNRHVFLDDVAKESAVRRQLDLLAEAASSRGLAIGIGHPYPVTLRVCWSTTGW